MLPKIIRNETRLTSEEKQQARTERIEIKVKTTEELVGLPSDDLIERAKDGFISRDTLQDLTQEQRRYLVQNDCMKYISDYGETKEPVYQTNVFGKLAL